MEEYLGPFTSNLEGSGQLKGLRAVYIYPPIDGLIFWHWEHGEWVYKDYTLYTVAPSFEPEDIMDVPAPASGYLFILVEEGWVTRATRIAIIDPDTAAV